VRSPRPATDERAARTFLLALALVFMPLFAIPLLRDPYAWARRFGWRPEPQTDIGLYFGRCLGAVAVGLTGGALAAARRPSEHRGLFVVLELSAWLLSVVHVRGLLERRQPPIEHAEIVGYAAVAVAARRVRPRAGAAAPVSAAAHVS
jgi:hypothetical protein